MIGSIAIVISFLVTVLFVIGLWYCKIHSFKAGVVFFILLIFNKVFSFIILPFLGRYYIDKSLSENKSLLFNLTPGETALLLSQIPKMIELLAFFVLILGLYHLWSSKKLSTN